MGRHPNSLKAIEPHQWPKGVSGNPNGRPKRKTIVEMLEEELVAIASSHGVELGPEERGRTAAKAWAAMIVDGNFQALREYIERRDGLATAEADHLGDTLKEVYASWLKDRADNSGEVQDAEFREVKE